MARIDIDTSSTSTDQVYRLLTHVVVPRPIAWVSSRSASGVDNLAPHSFFTVASTNPPVIQFTSVGRKNSLANIEETKQFVVCLAPEGLFEQVNATGTTFPQDVSEFDQAAIAREPSARVRPPRVRESPVALECELHSVVTVGNSFIVLGHVVHIAIDPRAMGGGDYPALDRLRPLSRLGGNAWGLTPESRDIARIPVDEWPGHYGERSS